MVFFRQDESLGQLVNQILATTRQQFPTLAKNQIALTWIVYDPPVIVNTGGALSAQEFWQYPVRGFSYRGVEKIYPASIVKLFYLVAIYEWLGKEMISDSPELQRAIQDSIVDSSNDATSLIVDILTGTTSGPELPLSPFETWKQQRNIVNRYFQSLGWEELESINVNQKPWNEGAYGREKAFLGKNLQNRNMLTTEAVSRLLHSIIGGVAVSRESSIKMMQMLTRRPGKKKLKPNQEEDQVQGFLGAGLPKQAKLWSKAGWTSQTRHDAAYIEVPNAKPYILIIFTEGVENAKNREILPFISDAFVAAVKSLAD